MTGYLWIINKFAGSAPLNVSDLYLLTNFGIWVIRSLIRCCVNLAMTHYHSLHSSLFLQWSTFLLAFYWMKTRLLASLNLKFAVYGRIFSDLPIVTAIMNLLLLKLLHTCWIYCFDCCLYYLQARQQMCVYLTRAICADFYYWFKCYSKIFINITVDDFNEPFVLFILPAIGFI